MTLRDRIVEYLNKIPTGPGSGILSGHIAQALLVPWEEIKSALDSMACEDQPFVKKNIRVYSVDDEDHSFPLSAAELEEAEATGELYHPETGDFVHNWRDKLWTSYMTTKNLPGPSALRKKVDDLLEALAAFGSCEALLVIHLECDANELHEFGEVKDLEHEYLKPWVTIKKGKYPKEQTITLCGSWKSTTSDSP